MTAFDSNAASAFGQRGATTRPRGPCEPLRAWLDVGAAPRRADALFVFAGREERKRHGLRLYEGGLARRLVLSVGRYEWRRFIELGLPADGGLAELVAATPPRRRHFFVELAPGTVSCRRVARGRLGTLGEAAALGAWLDETGARSVLLLSSGIHLRRARLAARAFVGDGIELTPVGLPDEIDPDRSARSVLRELAKYLGYRLLLSAGVVGRGKSLTSRGLVW